jgi:hypothetical protein
MHFQTLKQALDQFLKQQVLFLHGKRTGLLTETILDLEKIAIAMLMEDYQKMVLQLRSLLLILRVTYKVMPPLLPQQLTLKLFFTRIILS